MSPRAQHNLILLSALLFSAPAAAQEAPEPKAKSGETREPEARPEMKGPMADSAELLRGLLALRIGPEGLAFHRDAWVEAIAKIKEENQKNGANNAGRMGVFGIPGGMMGGEMSEELKALGELFPLVLQRFGSYSSSMSGGMGKITRSQEGDRLAARMVLSEPQVELTLEERVESGHRVELREGEGEFRLFVMDDAAKLFVLLHQTKDACSLVLRLPGREFQSFEAESFMALYDAQTPIIDEQLFPLLDALGLGCPMTPFHERVVASVLSQLAPLSAEDKARFEAQLAKLEDADYEVREAATRDLEAAATRFRASIETALAQGVPPETLMRLRSVLEADAAKNKDVAGIIEAFGLLRSPRYLVALLTRAPEADRGAVLEQLRAITGADLGEAPEPWQRALAAGELRAASAEPAAPAEPTTPEAEAPAPEAPKEE